MNLDKRAEARVEAARADEARADAGVEVVIDAAPFHDWLRPTSRPDLANRRGFETFSGGAGI
jgi:hypothetical protein